MSTKQKLLATLAAVGLMAGVAQAAPIVIFQDGFESLTAGDLNGQGTWTSPAGITNFVVNTTSGLGNAIIGGGGQRITSAANSNSNSDPTFATFAAASQDQVFVRFNYNATTTSGGPFFSFRLTGDNGDFNSTAGITVQNGQLRARTTDTSGNVTSTNGPNISNNTTHTIVFMAEKTGAAGNNYNRVTAWLNPALAGETAADLLAVTNIASTLVATADTGVSSFSAISFSTNASGARPGIQMDSIMVAAIPEPSTLALVGIALGSLLLFRRRKA